MNVFRGDVTIREQMRRLRAQLQAVLQQGERILQAVVAHFEISLEKNFVCECVGDDDDGDGMIHRHSRLRQQRQTDLPMLGERFASAIIFLNSSKTLRSSAPFSLLLLLSAIMVSTMHSTTLKIPNREERFLTRSKLRRQKSCVRGVPCKKREPTECNVFRSMTHTTSARSPHAVA